MTKEQKQYLKTWEGYFKGIRLSIKESDQEIDSLKKRIKILNQLIANERAIKKANLAQMKLGEIRLKKYTDSLNKK